MTANYLIQRVLDAPMEPADNDAEVASVREYLKALLVALWGDRGGNVSGKRPFGNSGWRSDIHVALVNAGLVPGTIDTDGYLHEFSDEAAGVADRMILEAIEALE